MIKENLNQRSTSLCDKEKLKVHKLLTFFFVGNLIPDVIQMSVSSTSFEICQADLEYKRKPTKSYDMFFK